MSEIICARGINCNCSKDDVDQCEYFAGWDDREARIEQLEREKAEREAGEKSALQEREAQAATIETLREALLNIDALDPERHAAGFTDAAMRGLVEQMGNIARQALKETSKHRSKDDPLGDGSDYGVTGQWWGTSDRSKDDA